MAFEFISVRIIIGFSFPPVYRHIWGFHQKRYRPTMIIRQGLKIDYITGGISDWPFLVYGTSEFKCVPPITGHLCGEKLYLSRLCLEPGEKAVHLFVCLF